MYLFGVIVIFVATVNPLNEAIVKWVSSLGLMLDNFGKLAFGVAPYGENDFTQNRVVFYWAWWLAYAPMMGLFVARISRGPMVRQVIGGMVVFGALASMLCFAWFGSYAVSLQHSGAVDLASIYSTAGREEAFFAILQTMPAAPVIEAVYIVLLAELFRRTKGCALMKRERRKFISPVAIVALRGVRIGAPWENSVHKLT